jgi:hypothetical protein
MQALTFAHRDPIFADVMANMLKYAGKFRVAALLLVVAGLVVGPLASQRALADTHHRLQTAPCAESAANGTLAGSEASLHSGACCDGMERTDCRVSCSALCTTSFAVNISAAGTPDTNSLGARFSLLPTGALTTRSSDFLTPPPRS